MLSIFHPHPHAQICIKYIIPTLGLNSKPRFGPKYYCTTPLNWNVVFIRSSLPSSYCDLFFFLLEMHLKFELRGSKALTDSPLDRDATSTWRLGNRKENVNNVYSKSLESAYKSISLRKVSWFFIMIPFSYIHSLQNGLWTCYASGSFPSNMPYSYTAARQTCTKYDNQPARVEAGTTRNGMMLYAVSKEKTNAK